MLELNDRERMFAFLDKYKKQRLSEIIGEYRVMLNPRKNAHGEYIVKVWHESRGPITEGYYHATEWKDAVDTFGAICRHYARQGEQ